MAPESRLSTHLFHSCHSSSFVRVIAMFSSSAESSSYSRRPATSTVSHLHVSLRTPISHSSQITVTGKPTSGLASLDTASTPLIPSVRPIILTKHHSRQPTMFSRSALAISLVLFYSNPTLSPHSSLLLYTLP